MARFRIVKSQPPIRGGRDPLPSCVLHDISRAVRADAVQFGVSRSWVIATILAAHYGIDEQINFKTARKKDERG